MTQSPVQAIDWPSFLQLIQHLINGSVKRNIFTKVEMELLLDLQMTHIRKSSRPEMLRRYLRVVQVQSSSEAAPLRFSHFVEQELHLRKSVIQTGQLVDLPRAS